MESLTQVSTGQEPKKHSIRYNFPDGSPVSSIYVNRKELERRYKQKYSGTLF